MAAKDRALKAAAVKIPAHVQRGKRKAVSEKVGRGRAEGFQDIRKHLRSALLELCVRHSDGASTRAARRPRRKRTRGKAYRRGDGNRLGRSDAKVRTKHTARYKTQMRNTFFGYQFYLACCIDAAVSFMLTQKLAEHGEVALRILEQGVVRGAAERLKAGIWQRAPAGHALLRAKVELTT